MVQEAVILIQFYDVAEHASRDPSCAHVQFPTTNVPQQINTEIRSFVVNIISARETGQQRQNSLRQVDSILKNFHDLRAAKVDERPVPEVIYAELKRRAFEAYGAQGACSAIAASIETVILQKRLNLRNLPSAASR